MSHAFEKWDRRNAMLLQINRTTALVQSFNFERPHLAQSGHLVEQ